MAKPTFVFDTNPASSIGKNEDWKALGFINLMVTNNAGSVSKLGAVGLKKSNHAHIELFNGLSGPECKTILEAIGTQVVLKFNPVGSGADWDFLENAEPAAATPIAGAKEQAIGYINLLLPDADGMLVQLGSVALFASNAREQTLFNALSVSADKNLAAIKARMSLTFFPTNTVAKVIKPGFAVLKKAA